MRKMMVMAMMLLSICSFSQYNIGDEVDAADNISWLISGPAGDPELGNSSDIFTKVLTDRMPVMIFCGQTW